MRKLLPDKNQNLVKHLLFAVAVFVRHKGFVCNLHTIINNHVCCLILASVSTEASDVKPFNTFSQLQSSWAKVEKFSCKTTNVLTSLPAAIIFNWKAILYGFVWTSLIPIAVQSTPSRHISPELSAGEYLHLIMQHSVLVEIIFTQCCRKHLSWQITWIKVLSWALAWSCVYSWCVIRPMLRWVSSNWPDHSSWSSGGQPHPQQARRRRTLR